MRYRYSIHEVKINMKLYQARNNILRAVHFEKCLQQVI